MGDVRQRLTRLGLWALAGLILASAGCGTLEHPRLTLTSQDLGQPSRVSAAAATLLAPGFGVQSVILDRSGAQDEGSFVVLTALRDDEILAREGPEEDNYRILAVLRKQEGDLYEVQVLSRRALAPFGWDEFSPDSLESVELRDGVLTISHYGGGRQRWARTDTFAFERDSEEWVLRSIELTYQDTQNLEAEAEGWLLTRRHFGRVLLQEFDIRKKPGRP